MRAHGHRGIVPQLVVPAEHALRHLWLGGSSPSPCVECLSHDCCGASGGRVGGLKCAFMTWEDSTLRPPAQRRWSFGSCADSESRSAAVTDTQTGSPAAT